MGRALVTVPKSHQVPNVERPWAIKIPYIDVTLYQESEDPKRHFTLQELKEMTKDELLVAELLKSRGRLPVDKISNELNLGLTATSSVLLELEFKGVVRSLPGKIYEIVSSLTIRV